MNRIFILALVLNAFTLTSLAQHNVILQSDGETTIFSSSNGFIDAYNAAVDGDTIYLPGLQYSSPSPIEKRITVYGTGYHPQHTQATGRTRINGFRFGEGSSGSHFEGMYVSSGIRLIGGLIEDITLKRMHVDAGISLNASSVEFCEECNNIQITESVFHFFNGQYSEITNLQIFNNIICNQGGQILNINNTNPGVTNVAWISNNVIIRNGATLIGGVYNSLFENNIFIRHSTSGFFSNYHGNTFRNNAFDFNPTTNEENSFENNYPSISRNAFFVDFPGAIYQPDNNYHIENPETYLGTTGNQIGIYGGISPFKENTRPTNPQIKAKDISHSTNEEGKLSIEIEVEAQ